MHREQTCSWQGMGREEEGWNGNLGLADVNCYIKNGLKKERMDRLQVSIV